MAGSKQNYIEGGMSSAIQRRQLQMQEKRLQREREQAAQVTPGIEKILEWIDEELDQVCDLRHMVIHVADKDLARDELLAAEKHMDFLEKLKGRATKIGRVANRAEKAAALENARKVKQYEKENADA